jgi:methylmalonyl-CoA/ethylmalonyl-CoA epimerase
VLSRIHHVGIVVRDLEQAYGFWRDLLGLPVHKVATVRDQDVRAALLSIGESEIELLQPLSETSGIGKFLAKRGEGLHHLCFATDDVAAELEAARAKGVRLIDQRPRPGLAGMICFLHPASTRGVLVEYAEPYPAGHPGLPGEEAA